MADRMPGQYACDWVSQLAQTHGSYHNLARAGGLTKGWASGAKGGAIPRPQTIRQLGQLADTPEEVLAELTRDIAAYWDGIHAGYHHGFVTLFCDDCRKERQIRRAKLGTFQPTQGKDERLHLRCDACADIRRARQAKNGRQIKLVTDAADDILRRRGKSVTAGECKLIEWLRDKKLRLSKDDMLGIVGAALAGDVVAKAVVDTLWEEYLLRKLGNGDIAVGRQARVALLRAGSKPAAQRPRPGRTYQSVRMADLAGTFSLCPLCGLLVYRKPSEVRSQIGWHGVCYRGWRRSPTVCDWSISVLQMGKRGIPKDMLPFQPTPPSQARSVPSDLLMAGYRAFIGAAIPGESHTELAARLGCTVEALRGRIRATSARLPARWSLLFDSDYKGNALRQKFHPLPGRLEDLRPERQERAVHLGALGIPVDVIAEVTGYRLAAE